MPIIRNSRIQCSLPHWSFRSWLTVGWRLGAVKLQPRHYSSLTAPNLQPTANQERNDQCGNEHCIREFLMMGIVVPETCWAYKKYNKIISSIYLVVILQDSEVIGKSKICWLYRKVSGILVGLSYGKGEEGYNSQWAIYALAAVLVFIRPV